MYHILIKYKQRQTGPDRFSTDEQRIKNIETYEELLALMAELEVSFLDQIIIART